MGAEIDPCGRGDPHRVLGVGVEVGDSVARTGIGCGDGGDGLPAGGVVVHATGLPLHEVAVGPGDRIPGHVQAPNAGLDIHPEDLTRRCLTGRRRRRALCHGLLRGPRDQDEDRDGPKRDREASAARRTGPGVGGPAIPRPAEARDPPERSAVDVPVAPGAGRACSISHLRRSLRLRTRGPSEARRGYYPTSVEGTPCPHGSGMCAVGFFAGHASRGRSWARRSWERGRPRPH